MNTITGFFVLLLAAVVENSRYDFNHTPLKKVFALLTESDDVDDHVSDPMISRRYQLMYDAATWVDAKKSCAVTQGKLAAPKTMYEFKLIQRLVRRMRFQKIKGATGTKHLAWVGISSLDDWTVWKNVDGDDIRTIGFSMWVEGGGTISPYPTEPHCAGIDAVNLLREYWCHRKQPYVCEFKWPADSKVPTKVNNTSALLFI